MTLWCRYWDITPILLMRKSRHRRVKVTYPRSLSKWQSWEKFQKASPPCPFLYFPTSCFLAIRDSAVVGSRLRAYPTSCTTLPQPSNVVPREDPSLSFSEAVPSSHKVRSDDDKECDITSENEFWLKFWWITTISASDSSPSAPTTCSFVIHPPPPSVILKPLSSTHRPHIC